MHFADVGQDEMSLHLNGGRVINNVYGTPDVGFVSGDSEAFKTISLFDTVTSSRGTAQSTSGVKVPQIGRAKSRGFEYSSGHLPPIIKDEAKILESYGGIRNWARATEISRF